MRAKLKMCCVVPLLHVCSVKFKLSPTVILGNYKLSYSNIAQGKVKC